MTKPPRLKVVRVQAPPAHATYTAINPEGVPADAKTLQAVSASDDYTGLGIYEGDVLVTWGDAPLRNYDLATVETTSGETYIGRYHSAPGGYVRLESGDDEDYHVFKPSEIQGVSRVMHVERRGEIVRLKGLELRGLPFADEVKEERRRGA